MTVAALAGERKQQPQARREEVLDAGDDDPLQRWQSRPHRLNLAEERREADHDAGSSVGQLMLQLGLDIKRTGWHHHRASPQPAVVGDHHLWTVRQQQRNAVTLLHAEREQDVGEAVGQHVELGVAERPSEEADGRPTRIASGGGRQRRVQWLVRNVNVGWYASVIRG